MTFPAGFVWGASTAAYQIEGGGEAGGGGAGGGGGRGSVWDLFSWARGVPGGEAAGGHEGLWPRDLDLLRDLGVGAYRFSVAWSRVQPGGRGRASVPGLAFYDRLTDELLGRGVQPWAALHHWDLPQALQDAGGWLARDTAYRFEEYASLVAERLADRVAAFVTLTDPFTVVAQGHVLGTHAPGLRLGLEAFPAAHHGLLAHGLAVRALREAGARQVGLANGYAPAWPATDRDERAATLMSTLRGDLFTDPLLRGEYPTALLNLLSERAPQVLEAVRAGDHAVMAAPLDFLGVHYTQPDWVRSRSGSRLGLEVGTVPDRERTASGASVVPEGLTQTLTGLKARYGDTCPPLIVTVGSAGAADTDTPDEGGRVRDDARIRYLDRHLEAVADALTQGAPVRGVFVHSLLDGFEWDAGYRLRTGLVHVDFGTLERTPRDSYRWLRDRLRTQG
ncbi:glycoside hydrolase family 1 protein [Deinococcus sp. UR1]|uniref:glycoside hydrolase family 1 protein n=3 Tax=unclassified Deinococcus TaxID=2623546 RepID=UPI000C19F879|nr:family 1 glycosylhydrolase [Deinococcus sp. UR1]PIG99113.1 beta-glucosidase [Deinococcus sp. UR1]